jgi:dipeptidyl aminopeptidase
MAHEQEAHLLPAEHDKLPRKSEESLSSTSVASVVFEGIGRHAQQNCLASGPRNEEEEDYRLDLEASPFIQGTKSSSKSFKRLVWVVGGLFVGVWVIATFVFLGHKAARQAAEYSTEETAGGFRNNGKKVTLDQVMSGQWSASRHAISWIEGANGEDGRLLERGAHGKDYLVVEDVREKSGDAATSSKTLMKDSSFKIGDQHHTPSRVWPSKDLKKVLIATDVEQNWRHSFYARYWIFDVESQTAQPLDPTNIHGRVQLASWSPQSDAIVFTRDNNMCLRKLSSPSVIRITKDGGKELFYGVPDWVYEEEVFQDRSATWWAEDGKYIAFLRTDESAVPEYPIQYFVSRPSGKQPAAGEENYPEVSEIKYPKAGAPNPTVSLLFYDVERNNNFEVKISDEFPANDRLITEVVWAGSKVLIRETNRESDILRVVLVDVPSRTGKTVRTVDITALDGGWLEVTQRTRYIPADPAKGRAHDGYIDTVIYQNNDHLGYFTPLDNPDPVHLTSGDWEVVNAPSAVDLEKNLVYFVATKESPIQRHVYSVKLDGTDLKALTDTSNEGHYAVTFSSGAGYALLNYDGPKIPWQKVISTPSNANKYERVLEENPGLAEMAKTHELPRLRYSTVTIDGFELQVVERLPPHFNEKKKHPVLFHLYGGPGSQTVSKRFNVDFQAYIAASMGYIVVTVDGRGTGYIGRKARCIIRGNIGYWESRDQIETAKIWAQKKYVDASRMAIWGWSYGGFMTLKTLEQDAGQTFKYGMAVAPVTDWRFYDSIYTERYMRTPQHNPGGYDNSTISNMTALHQNVRFLLMHGVADDNVHMQNSLTLIDKLDLAGVENYDVHVFPDSNHGIYFHNANRIVYDSKYLHKRMSRAHMLTVVELNNWIVNAFNGEWLKVEHAKPMEIDTASKMR